MSNQSQKKIVHIITGMDVGGAENSLLKILASSDKTNTKVISLTNRVSQGQKVQKLGIDLIVLGLQRWNVLPKFVELIFILRRYKPDIVQTWLYHSDLFGGLAAYICGVESIFWNVRTTELRKDAFQLKIIRKLLARLSYFLPTSIVAVGERSKDKHLSIGYSQEKFIVIPNGYCLVKDCVGTIKDFNLYPQNPIQTHEVVSGMIGRYSPIKGHDTMIKAAGLILKKFDNVRFLLAGRGVDFSNTELCEQIKGLCDINKFILLGERSDMQNIYNAMNVFVLPSYSEGFPNALAEAMSYAIPCVSTDAGDAKVLVNGITPIVKPGDYEELANSISYLLELEPENLRQIGQRMQNTIQKNHSLEVMLQRYSHLYNTSLETNRN